MATSVKKTISLPLDLAEEAETRAREEGKTLSEVIQGALRLSRRLRLQGELQSLQGYWSKKAKERGILTERALARYLEECGSSSTPASSSLPSLSRAATPIRQSRQ